MPGEYTGFILLGLSARLDAFFATSDDLRRVAREAGADDLSRVLDDYPECPTRRVVSSVPAARIRELERKAVERGFARDRSLASYWRIDTRKSGKREEFLDRLSKTESVERAYFEMRGSDPQVNAADDVFAVQQFHLDAAPAGIDARWAWTQPNGSGTSVGFVDLEQGWILNHQDLPAIAALPGVGQDVSPDPVSQRHGTGVMGIVVGVDNALGIIGVAPTPAWVSIASHYWALDGTSDHVADAITAVVASGALAAGDVLLIEYQNWSNQPAEADPIMWDAIDLATALDTVVIEAAGNGNSNLDNVPGLNRHDRKTFRDTRAIIVGASRSTLDATGTGHDRWVLVSPSTGPGSNFGSRVDCYAFGENVVTAGPTPDATKALGPGTLPMTQYRSDFGGTSAAAAIVAGAAVVLQGLHRSVKGTSLSPTQMRAALSTNGTPQGTGLPGHIGVMPDLKKAAYALSLIKPPPTAPTNLRIQP
jgi:serine protease